MGPVRVTPQQEDPLTTLLQRIPRYWKAILAAIPLVTLAVGEVVEAIDEAGSDGTITNSDWRNIAIAAVTVVFVYFKRNVNPVGLPPDPTISEAEVKP